LQSPFAHVPVHVVAPAQSTWHGGLWQVKSQWLFDAQLQLPFAQAATQDALLPAHCTLQGGAEHSKLQLSPSGQEQAPFAQSWDLAPQLGTSANTESSVIQAKVRPTAQGSHGPGGLDKSAESDRPGALRPGSARTPPLLGRRPFPTEIPVLARWS
jgi:hypothetical protein